jgi:RNA polymerase sigma-70 factor (ECF subfamily)
VDEDAQHAKAAAAGDAAAFTKLVRRHEGAVRQFLLRLSGDAADDLAQEVFIQAWRLGSSWRETGTYRSWLMGIAWTQFLGARRGDQRRVARESSSEDDSATADADVQIDVRNALALLDERERAAAILCYGEGCSHSEAAAIMGTPLGTLKSILARARTRLAQRLELVDD